MDKKEKRNLENVPHEDDDFISVLRQLAPGTRFRKGLDNILRARLGALIVLVSNEKAANSLVDGGIRLNMDFAHETMYELAKMDGAILVSGNLRKILYANSQLAPDLSIPTTETGIRHRTAQRSARQLSTCVIAVSRRRETITLYVKSRKYELQSVDILLNKATQALQTLDRYREVMRRILANLNVLELENLVTLEDVVNSIQHTGMVMRISNEIERYLAELGDAGRLLRMQYTELIMGVGEGLLVVRDYFKGNPKKILEIHHLITEKSITGPIPSNIVASLLDYTATDLSASLVPRGYRILNKVPRLNTALIDNIVKLYGNLQNILNASVEDLVHVEGVGEVRAKAIKDGLYRIKNESIFESK